MTQILILLMGTEPEYDLNGACDMIGFGIPLALGIMLILRKGKCHGVD